MMVEVDRRMICIQKTLIGSLVTQKIKKDEEVTGYYINGYEDKGIKVLTKKKNS